MAWRYEMALSDIDEGVLLQTPRGHALCTAVVEKPGIAQVVLGAAGQIADLHAPGQAQQRHQ